MYKIIAIIGESGSGKDTVLKKLIEANPNLHKIIPCTTRPMREGEVDGVDYLFLDNYYFALKIKRGEMLEATSFNDWFYGTSYDSLDESKINVGVFNPEGVRNLFNYSDKIDAKIFRIESPARLRLIRQLSREENPNIEEIIRRYGTDKTDFESLSFGYTSLRNETYEDLQACVQDILDSCETSSGQGQKL